MIQPGLAVPLPESFPQVFIRSGSAVEADYDAYRQAAADRRVAQFRPSRRRIDWTNVALMAALVAFVGLFWAGVALVITSWGS